MLPSIDGLFVFAPCACCGADQVAVRYPIDLVHASSVSAIDIETQPIGVAVCSRCGHEFVQPVPQPKFLSAYYSNYMSRAKTGFYQARSGDSIPDRFRERYEPWVRLMAVALDGRRLLDVGAGLGMFLRLAERHGFEVQGVEPNKEAADALRDNHGISVANCLFEQVELKKTVDVITMWDLLEHLADPRAALAKASRVLAPKGLLVLEIPARDSLLHDLAKWMYRFSAGRIRRPLYLICGLHHLHYFSERDISQLLVETGFKVREVYRGETELESLLRGKGGRFSLAAEIYNAALRFLFASARLLRRQNKLIIFAEKS